jgi:hypothetical protein
VSQWWCWRSVSSSTTNRGEVGGEVRNALRSLTVVKLMLYTVVWSCWLDNPERSTFRIRVHFEALLKIRGFQSAIWGATDGSSESFVLVRNAERSLQRLAGLYNALR